MSESDAVGRAMESAGTLFTVAHSLDVDRDATTSRLRAELTGGRTRLALLLLPNLSTDYTVALVDVLVSRALSARDTLLVRQILGRLPRSEVEGVVPRVVRAQLYQTPDEDAYRTMLGLLDYLGLDGALGELVETALASDDPDVCAVGEEYRTQG